MADTPKLAAVGLDRTTSPNVPGHPAKPSGESRRRVQPAPRLAADLALTRDKPAGVWGALGNFGLLLSVLWLAACAAYAQQAIGWDNVMLLLPHEVGGLLAGAAAPLVLLWIVLGYFQRAVGVARATEPVRRQIEELSSAGSALEQRLSQATATLRGEAGDLGVASEAAVSRIGVLNADLRG